jgi:23S rRNA (guanosine2251-2'-O)-methyltransferase
VLISYLICIVGQAEQSIARCAEIAVSMKRWKKTLVRIRPPHLSIGGGESPSASSTHEQPPTSPQLVFGIEPVRELLAAGQEVDILYVSERLKGRFVTEMRRVEDAGGKIAVVGDKVIQQLCGFEARHQGLAAVCRGFDYAALDDVLALTPDPLLIVDGVTDPRNLGAIMRSAEGAGVRAMVLARDRTTEVTATAMKTSAGARAHLKIARCGNVAATLKMLKERGYWVGGLAPHGELSVYELDVSRRLALVVGGEQRGLRPLVARSCDFLAAIPMYGKVASLNVAVASAVALYEIARRRACLGGARRLASR